MELEPDGTDKDKSKSEVPKRTTVGEYIFSNLSCFEKEIIGTSAVSTWLRTKVRQEKRAKYGQRQLLAAQLMESYRWEVVMGIIIAINVVFIIVETNIRADCRRRDGDCEIPVWLDCVNYLLLAIYIVEVALRIFAYRLDFWQCKWNLIDLFVVTMGIMDLVVSRIASANHSARLPNMPIFRLLRIARLLRAFRLLFVVREFYLLLHGFLSSLSAIFWGCILMLGLVMIWAIVSVELLDSINRNVDHGSNAFCDRAFSSVWFAALLFFQTMMIGDNWGACAIPLIEHEPWTFIVFFGALGTILMGFANLILAVIVARTQESREADHIQKSKEKEIETAREKKRLLQICHSIKRDQDSSVTLLELLHAFDHDIDLRTIISLMDIEKDELASIYQLVDEHRAGKVSIVDFVTGLFRLKSRDTQTLLAFLKYHILCIDQKMDVQMDDLERAVMSKLDAQGTILSSIQAQLAEKSVFKRSVDYEKDWLYSNASMQSPFHLDSRDLESPPRSADIKRYVAHHQRENLIAIGQQLEALASQLTSQLFDASHLVFDTSPSDRNSVSDLTPKHIPLTPVRSQRIPDAELPVTPGRRLTPLAQDSARDITPRARSTTPRSFVSPDVLRRVGNTTPRTTARLKTPEPVVSVITMTELNVHD